MRRQPGFCLSTSRTRNRASRWPRRWQNRCGERGCDVQLAGIELTDSRYAERFTRFPLRHPYLDIFGMMPAQVRGATGEIRIPDGAQAGDYDLVVVGSPTWWLKTSLPIRSWLKSDAAGRVLKGKRFAAYVVCRRYWGLNLRTVRRLGTERGGEYVDGIHFSFAGGQVRSLLSLLSYFGTGVDRERYLGIKIPPTNLKPDYLEQARAFATGLADRRARRCSKRLGAFAGAAERAT